MRVSPLDIRKQEFTRSFRGYEPEEVDAFLQMLSTEWEEMRDEHRRIEDQVRGLEDKIRHYERVEEALQEALQTARDSSRKTVENAEDRARNIIRNAEADADRIQGDAATRRDKLRQENTRLLNRRHELVARLRAFLTAEIEMLERFESDQIVGEHSDEVEREPTSRLPSAGVALADDDIRESEPEWTPDEAPAALDEYDDGGDQSYPDGHFYSDDQTVPDDTTLPDEHTSPEQSPAESAPDEPVFDRLRLVDRPDDDTDRNDDGRQPEPDVEPQPLTREFSSDRDPFDEAFEETPEERERTKARQATEEIEKIRRILNDLD